MTQRAVTWWSHDPMVGVILEAGCAIQENKKKEVWSAGQSDVWGSIGLYLYDEDTHSWGAEVGGHSVITFWQKLRPESSHPSSYFYNSVRLAETWLDRKARVCGTVRNKKGHSIWTGMAHCIAFPMERWCNGPSVDRQKTCAIDKCDPKCDGSEHRNERQMNRPWNKQTLYCFPVQ